jgi:hypothetical protein
LFQVVEAKLQSRYSAALPKNRRPRKQGRRQPGESLLALVF